MPTRAYDRALSEASKHHASSKTYSGKLLRPHKPFLLELIAKHRIKSAIDIGCGKGSQYSWVDPVDGKTMEQAFGFEVAKFDPAWPPYAEDPGGVFDLAICTHTLNCIPISDLPWMIAGLHERAAKAVFIAEKLGPRKKGEYTSTEDFPHNWTRDQWQAIIAPHYKRGVVTYLSTRSAQPWGTLVERHKLTPQGRWNLVFTSEPA